MTVAALYVETNGVYYGLDDVDPWDEARDARLYAGPWPVVAHPPCARWCRLAGFVEHRLGYKRGEDGGCFAAALEAVRTFGGVLEHPAHSAAWRAFDLPTPTRYGWGASLLDAGWTCAVDQGFYGHGIRKETWLYAHGIDLPNLRWGQSPRGEYHWGLRSDGRPDLPHAMRNGTPLAFRDVLLDMARSAQRVSLAGPV